ncbi:MAG: abortive infection family protein [Parabacteroides sp.]|nr:abortive infection family protein [Parabacteroides sp.]
MSYVLAPISDDIIIAVSKLIDDALLAGKREPTHSEIDYIVQKTGLGAADPKMQGKAFGKAKLDTSPVHNMERALYQLGCSINQIRNKQGTGHGRPFETTILDYEARTAIQCMGIISEYMLKKT